MSFPSQDADRFNIRLPGNLRDRIKAIASANGRSANTEIVKCLEAYASGETEQEAPSMAKGQNLTIRIDEATRERLDQLSKRGPYRISITSIVERGIELAAEELERMEKAK